jgi:uncharacterized surface anchored protein
MAYIDIYTVGYSPEFIITGREEITESMALTQNPVVNSGNLKGTVTSGGAGVSGATVKVYDINDNPIEHTNTGGNGQYTIASLPAGSYKVTAIMDGYLLPLPTPVIIQANKATTADIILTPDPEDGLSVVYGIISSGGAPLSLANVSLYSNTSPEPTLFISASTNDRGQYIFGLIPPGDYFVLANKLGYYPNQTSVFNIGTKKIIAGDIPLTADTQANTGTVSGFITDSVSGLPIQDAGVALYSLAGGNETVIDTTRTNASGMYLFTNVGPGTYLVKSTKQQPV